MKTTKITAVLFSAVFGLVATVSTNAQESGSIDNINQALASVQAPIDNKPIQTPTLSTTANEAENVNFELYPNPGNGIMRVNEANGPVKIEVYDLAGNLHLKESVSINAHQSLKIDLANLKDGMYIVKLNGKSLRYIKQ